MFTRHRAILRLVQNEGGTVSRLRLVKLAFLLSREPDAPPAGVYDFLPYKRGPFSFTLYQDLRGLQRSGWLAEGEQDISVVEAPHLETAFLDKEFLDLIDLMSRQNRSLATSALVDRVYATFPWFTLNSEVIHKRAVQRPVAKPAVFTVGYEGMMVDALLDLLLRNGIQKLIDVRSNPIARRYGFHKSTLGRLCGDVGIQYVHFASLGVPSAWRANLSDQSSYDLLFARYRTEILPRQYLAVESVATLMKESPSALMCMEANHESCHRSSLAAKISTLTSLRVHELRGT
jgi:uncharacterized protein (DUF488 family)